MAERRERIVARAHAILGEGGVAALTIERLSSEAEVAPRTIYRLFKDKEGVIFATVADRLREVREHIARRGAAYTVDVVFDELDWMVSEMDRDAKYARVVIGFFFSMEPRTAAIRELGSVAYNRFRNWLDLMIDGGHVRGDLDAERVAQELVATEFTVYRRWAIGAVDSATCRLELRANFLKTAAVLLKDPVRETYLGLLANVHGELGLSALGAGRSGNRAERDAGLHFDGRA